MSKVIDNIKNTFAELFGFKDVDKVKEWDECLAGLEKSGEISAADVKAFKDSEKQSEDFIKRLEVQNGAEKKVRKARATESQKQKKQPEKEISLARGNDGDEREQ